jgi:hypothetical protein
MLIGHKEWAPNRKIDPRYSMAWMRNKASTVLQQQEDGLSKAEVDEIKRYVRSQIDSKCSVFRVNPRTGKSYGTMHREVWEGQQDLTDDVTDLVDGRRPLVTSQQTGSTVRVSAQVAHAQNKVNDVRDELREHVAETNRQLEEIKALLKQKS